jgi:hypothetical protein
LEPVLGLKAQAAYDKLIAISHHIINYGFMSDLLHLSLTTTQLALLPSGRPGVERAGSEEALSASLRAHFHRYGLAVDPRVRRRLEPTPRSRRRRDARRTGSWHDG